MFFRCVPRNIVMKQMHNTFKTLERRKITKFEEAVNYINSLQTNAEYRQNVNCLKHSPTHSTTIAKTQKYLIRSGLSLEELDKLSAIHVSGTKGKGSTCAFCESILRHHGYKTGFYSSPHLINIRERIKINGKPVDEDLFSEKVIGIYKQLNQQKEDENDMPLYFRFLTIVAFHIFVAEKVDVAVIEVGIGGEFDCTNILRKTKVVGITTLGLDHTNMLGDTIDKIAWQKGGIMKSTARAFTVNQNETAMEVLKQRSIERNCPLNLAPKYEDYNWGENNTELGIHGEVQKINASLAIQLAHYWMSYNGDKSSIFKDNRIIPQLTKEGLQNCKLPGRFQILKLNNATVFVDGAHTSDSLQLCMEWFKNNTNAKSKVLIYNMIGNRSVEKHLGILQNIDFSHVIFVPNITFKEIIVEDEIDLKNTAAIQIEKCKHHKNVWIDLIQKKSNFDLKQNILTLYSIEEAMEEVTKIENPDILITGSLHLVGSALNYFHSKLKLNFE